MIKKKYDFFSIEKNKTKNYWKKISSLISKEKKETLLMPPPNITEELHLGHFYEIIIQDFLVRSSYINKNKIFWIPGIDHAGISTQGKIEKLNLSFKKENEKFNYTLKKWYPKVRKDFYRQWEKMGLLIDYKKAKFTLDRVARNFVSEAFISLYEKGIIYRRTSLVNLDPYFKSVVSDIELDHRISKSKLYYLKYLIDDKNDYLLVATTKPETFFADVALFVNPLDERYKNFIGKKAIHPFNKKKIPILSEETIKKDFGSGVLKCTPGHDASDYNLAKKHNLPIISCCDEKGKLNKMAGLWEGFLISEIREELVNNLQKEGICLKIENYLSNSIYSLKSNKEVETILSKQWFINLPKLIKIIKERDKNFLSEIDFLTPDYKEKLEEWCNKSHDWCISRQLWWGHKIPSWYNKKTKEIYVGKKIPFEKKEWIKDKDVLDTWFSSCLWPLISLAKNDDFNFNCNNFEKITKLVTGYDITFFWVLRMILLVKFFTNKVPFKQIIFHGLIRDEHGKKMSKSLGNGINPEKIIKEYGCDSLRLSFLQNNVWSSDLNYQEKKIIYSWRFCQKIWSIYFLIRNKIEKKNLIKIKIKNIENIIDKNLINIWILNKLNNLQKSYINRIKKNEISAIINEIIFFTKEEFSNKYLEIIKNDLEKNDLEKILLFSYQQLLIILHPFIPFVTEYIYNKITKEKLLESKIEIFKKNFEEIWEFDLLFILIREIKKFKKKAKDFYLDLFPEWKEKKLNFYDLKNFLNRFNCPIVLNKDKNYSFFIDLFPFGNLWYNKEINIEEIKNKLIFYEKEILRSSLLLENKKFLDKAPIEIVEKERNKKKYYNLERKKVIKKVEQINKIKNKK